MRVVRSAGRPTDYSYSLWALSTRVSGRSVDISIHRLTPAILNPFVQPKVTGAYLQATILENIHVETSP